MRSQAPAAADDSATLPAIPMCETNTKSPWRSIETLAWIAVRVGAMTGALNVTRPAAFQPVIERPRPRLLVIGSGVELSTRHQKPLAIPAASAVLMVEADFAVRVRVVPTSGTATVFERPPWTCTPPADPGVREAIWTLVPSPEA